MGNDAVAHLLFGLVLLSGGAWFYGRNQARHRGAASIVALLLGAAALLLAWPDSGVSSGGASKAAGDWQPYSHETIAGLRARQQPAFVDFTASWCITCQVNKRVALNSDAVQNAFSERGIARIKADWTRQDPVITAALAEFGRNAVPLYVFYPEQGEPIILPEILTPEVVLSAIGPRGSAKNPKAK
jgi:thiol:disulfide interchange protein DsbD